MYFSNKENHLLFIYNIGIYLVSFGLKCITPFNLKIKQGVKGRNNTFAILKKNISTQDKTLWFHCASLGEYEQGLPVFRALKTIYPSHKIVLTFFSPSGYEIRKEKSIADVVVYLPLDTIQNANRFLDLVHPELTIFVKYEIWPNFLNALKKRNSRALLISALFKNNQLFFKFYGTPMRQALFTFEHIFTQNESSKILLNTIQYNHVTVSGDTRFDRVYSQLDQDNTLAFIEEFKGTKLCVVAGSTWPEDEALLSDYINSHSSKDLKFIIAPHNIKESQIEKLQKSLRVKSVLYSNKDGKSLSDFQVLIIDTIGLLSKTYNYANIAYIGGAMGTKGLHNTLEAAVFGIPIIIGKNHSGFPEAEAMINNHGMFSIATQNELRQTLNHLIENPTARANSGTRNLEYIQKNKGAVVQIINFIRK